MTFPVAKASAAGTGVTSTEIRAVAARSTNGGKISPAAAKAFRAPALLHLLAACGAAAPEIRVRVITLEERTGSLAPPPPRRRIGASREPVGIMSR
jgi:hypothetical protein